MPSVSSDPRPSPSSSPTAPSSSTPVLSDISDPKPSSTLATITSSSRVLLSDPDAPTAAISIRLGGDAPSCDSSCVNPIRAAPVLTPPRSAPALCLLEPSSTATTTDRPGHQPFPSSILRFFSRMPLRRALLLPLSHGLSRLYFSSDFFDRRDGLLSCLSAGFQAFESHLRRVRHGRPLLPVIASTADGLLPYHRLTRAFSHFRALSRRRRLLLDIAARFPYALPPVYFKRHQLRLVADGRKTCDARISSDPFYHLTPGSCVLASCGSSRFPITILRTRSDFASAASAWLHFGTALFPSAGTAKAARVEFESLYRSRSRGSLRRRPIMVHSIGLLPYGTSCPLPPFHPYRLAFRA